LTIRPKESVLAHGSSGGSTGGSTRDCYLLPLPPGTRLIKKKEKEMAQGLQNSGKWRHLWRIAGQYANISVF